MAAFENVPDTWQREDWALLQNGFVSLFWNRDIFEHTQGVLAGDGYKIVRFDGSSWDSKAAMLASFADLLDFPDHFGRNLDALVDCLRDVAAFGYGSDPTSAGTVIAIDRLDSFAKLDRRTAQVVLDTLADTGR